MVVTFTLILAKPSIKVSYAQLQFILKDKFCLRFKNRIVLLRDLWRRNLILNRNSI